jgi:hypothetical protein
MRDVLISIMAILASGGVLCGGVSVGQEAKPQVWDFENATVGRLPPGWTAAKTGEGEGSVWKVMEDSSAPSGAKVLAQTAASPRAMFNLCVADGTALQNLELTVAFKAVEGKVDQGGGLVWRYVDANNYYIARFNPLEDNYRLYKVVEGKRIQLETKEGLKAPAGQWHTLAIKMTGDAIECSLNGTKHLAAKDDTLTKPGKVGLWTKADARTYFDKLEGKAVK